MGTIIATADREQITAISERATTAAMRRRAEVLLHYDQGLSTQEVAERVELSAGRVRYWRRRYLFEGMQIFAGSELVPPAPIQESDVEESTDLQLLPTPASTCHATPLFCGEVTLCSRGSRDSSEASLRPPASPGQQRHRAQHQ